VKHLIGKRIRLLSMSDEPNPIPVGIEGVVDGVMFDRGQWQLDVKWDNGRSLMLIYPHDKFEVLT
jgi:hypothetical protein